ncbi:MAG TPA: phospholipase D-like domain-containing protein [Arenimonas sp.]|nr:phospholipase D-like domain-containing protein [Arenimonas sp.]
MLWVIAISVLVTSLVLVLLQNFKTPEKSLERKADHRYSVSDSQFRREMSVLMGPAILRGNHVTALQNGVEIFPAMLRAIASAQTSITFETFIYWSGETGEAFSQALSERARAGVPVNVIIDWVGSTSMDQSLLDAMEAAGVRLHRYRPLRWYNLGRMNNRTHRKLLVIDGRVGFTGGVGIADQWAGNAGDPEHWRDTHFRIEGPVVAQFQAAFNDNWIKITGYVLNGPGYFPALAMEEEGVEAHMFVASPSGGSESMHLMYLLAIAASEATIDLAASYFVPDELLIEALVAACDRGVRVRILVPGPHLDALAVKIASKADWGRLLQAGAEIHIYQPTMLHTKLLVIDAEFVSVGSTNFDIRSIQLNDEASLNIYSRDFAEKMTAVFEDDLLEAESYSLAAWQGRPLGEKITETLLLPIKSQL